MSPEQAAKVIRDAIEVTRGDIARAKQWLVQIPGGAMDELPVQWLAEQGFAAPKQVDIDAADCVERLPVRFFTWQGRETSKYEWIPDCFRVTSEGVPNRGGWTLRRAGIDECRCRKSKQQQR